MSTDWNIGENARNGLAKKVERAILIAVSKVSQDDPQTQEYLDELSFLAETAGAVEIKRFVQKMDHPNPKTFIGKGKLEEISEYVVNHDVDLVIFDDDLSAKQQSILEKELKRKILDRSSLILDIFASRAQTAQAKTQVELAQMEYLLPRLRGLWTHLERQRGGIGMRGPGEKEIETDRRIVRDKISMLKERLERIDRQSATQRKNRASMVRVALVGYTNAGKSTLMNTLGKAEVFAENKLFATLDTTVRKVVIDRMPFLLSDTVGFIRKLPHQLVESFKSTLAETLESDLLVHVVDISHPQYEDHINTVRTTLNELGVNDIQVIYVFNKIDQYRERYYDDLLEEVTLQELEEQFITQLKKQYGENCYIISATTGEGLSELRDGLKKEVSKLYVNRYPYLVKQYGA